MISGAHLLLSSRNPEADRAFFRDILRFPWVDAGEGWLIFALPPAEIGIHPAAPEQADSHAGHDLSPVTLYLMCTNLRATVEELSALGVPHAEFQEARWGATTSIRLPGGASLGLYEPRHPLAIRRDTNAQP